MALVILETYPVGAAPSPARSLAEWVRASQAQSLRTAEINHLQTAVTALGGAARLRQCGEPLTRLEYQTILAYTLGENVVRVGFKYGQAIAHGNPIVMFTPTSHGWVVQAMHQVSPACRSTLPSSTSSSTR